MNKEACKILYLKLQSGSLIYIQIIGILYKFL